MTGQVQLSEAEIVVRHCLRDLGSRSGHEENMRPDAVMMLVRVLAGDTFAAERPRAGRGRMFMVALVQTVINLVMLDCTDGFGRGMAVVTRACGCSGATTHHVLSSERNKHHQ